MSTIALVKAREEAPQYVGLRSEADGRFEHGINLVHAWTCEHIGYGSREYFRDAYEAVLAE